MRCCRQVNDDKTVSTITLRQGAFRPGSVLVFRVASPHFLCITGSPPVPYFVQPSMPLEQPAATSLVRSTSWPCLADPGTYDELTRVFEAEAVTLVALNRLLFCSDPEERDLSGGARGVYDVPRYVSLPRALSPWLAARRLRAHCCPRTLGTDLWLGRVSKVLSWCCIASGPPTTWGTRSSTISVLATG